MCIPAYRAADFLAETLRSVLGQTHSDLRILVGIDPSDEETGATVSAIEPFLHDPRLRMIQNPVRLGWADNINALLGQVETPFFAILPHDDVWSPVYVATLLGALDAEPEAVVAYGDLLRFGFGPATRKSVALSGKDRCGDLLQFLLRGAEAMPWRGVTRRHVLDFTGGFPTDRHQGFAVECEYALALIGAGRVVHLPQVLYFKRIHPPEATTASKTRIVQFRAEELRAAWHDHDHRMSGLLHQALTACAVPPLSFPLYRAALDGAMLSRLQAVLGPTLRPTERERARQGLEDCESLVVQGAGQGAAIAANLHLVLHRHWFSLNNTALAAEHADCAWRLNPRSSDTNLAVAHHMVVQGRQLEALKFAMEAIPLNEEGDALAFGLVKRIYAGLGWGEAAI